MMSRFVNSVIPVRHTENPTDWKHKQYLTTSSLEIVEVASLREWCKYVSNTYVRR